MKYDNEQEKHGRGRIGRELYRFGIHVGSSNIATYAAGIALYFFLSLIPLFIILCSLLPYTDVSMEDLIKAVTNITPDIADRFVSSIIADAYRSRMSSFSISIVLILWSSSSGIRSLAHALDMMYEVNDQRKSPKLVGYSLLYTLILLAAVIILILFYVKMAVIPDLLASNADNQEAVRMDTLLWRQVIMYLTAFVIFALIYTYVPAGRRRFAHQIPGALLSTVAWFIFSKIFTDYENGYNIFSTFYGSLTAIAIFLFWLYCCFAIFLIGALFNFHFEEWIRKGMPMREDQDGK